MKYTLYYFKFPKLQPTFLSVTHVHSKNAHLLVLTLLIPDVAKSVLVVCSCCAESTNTSLAHVCFIQFLQTSVIYSEEICLISAMMLGVLSRLGVCQPAAIVSVIVVGLMQKLSIRR